MSDKEKPIPATARPENFYWIMSDSKFMYTPTRQLFEAPAVRRQIGAEAATLVEHEKVCSSQIWAPGLPMFVQDKAVIDGVLCDHPGNNLFNLYKPAPTIDGDPKQAKFWLELGEKLWGDDHERLLDYLAFKVQHPEIKINHCIVLGSFAPGIGKDSWLHPVRRGVGNWNWQNISASRALKDATSFNAFLRRTIVRISEVHDLGPARFPFFDVTKDWHAAPPETLTVADKHVKAYEIMNVVNVIYTLNHKSDGLFLPPEDRRHFVAWSECKTDDFSEEFWKDYWHKIEKQGYARHVAALLATRDVSAFNPGAPPPKTDAWHAIVAANQEPQDAELLDVLDKLGHYDDFGWEPGRPEAVTLDQVRKHAECPTGLAGWLGEMKNLRAANHRLERAGYSTVINRDREDGRWRINGARQTVYARQELSSAEKQKAVSEMIAWTEFKSRLQPAKTAAEQAKEDFDE